MSEKTKIEWADSTASPWTGCTPVSAGCDHCYARTLAKRYGWSQEWGAGVPRHRFAGFELKVGTLEDKAAAGWFKQCTGCGARGWANDHGVICGNCGISLFAMDTARPRIFPSLCDWLDPEVPVEWLADLLDVIRRTPHLDWLLLTKRPGMWRKRMEAAWRHLDSCRFPHERFATLCMVNAWLSGEGSCWPPENVWIGATVENQAAAEERIPDLLRIPAAVRFLSVEPMLGPVDVSGWIGPADGKHPAMECPTYYDGCHCADAVHAVFCGGESGPGARPMHPDWPRALRDQCVSAGVPFLFKQWGEWGRCGENGLTLDDASWGSDRMGFWRTGEFVAGATTGGEEHMVRVGKERAGRLLDGREWNEMPK